MLSNPLRSAMRVLCLIFILVGTSLPAKTEPQFVVYTKKETMIYNNPDTSDCTGRIKANTDIKLKGIKGDNDWILVSYNSMTGWIKANQVKLRLKSIIRGYRLRLNLRVKPTEFQSTTGLVLEEIKLTKEEKRSRRFIFEGWYLKQIFDTVEDAELFGDLLVERGLLWACEATGLNFRIIPVFNPDCPHLYLGICGGMELYKLQCPVCGGVLCDPSIGKKSPDDYPTERAYLEAMKWANRLYEYERPVCEIYQCVEGHLVAVFRMSWD